ncbi:hypothetical protein NP233_g3905 [Leucocoprinus birnbaumii]|uniref:F-box domain-containing protein n=1 Tax=Leucocoprinus birnbaumii TaxID=56174 RepID=A0AAD5YXM4_9AGAR|nr:hypothetical protein NP233_g3905 [Leucocoprinus birnbaumii]
MSNLEGAPIPAYNAQDDTIHPALIAPGAVTDVNDPIEDLPYEIWDEICSYLPAGYAVKMIGVNRYFFEVGMNSIYGTVCISDIGDKEQSKALNQLKSFPDLALRVRHLRLSPSFLPLCNHEGEPAVHLPSRTSALVKQMSEALSNCVNLEELEMNFHFFRAPTTDFLACLSHLVDKVSSSLIHLKVVTPIIHSQLLATIATCGCPPRLESVSIAVIPLYYSADLRGGTETLYIRPTQEHMQSFIGTTRRLLCSSSATIRKLSISNHDLLSIFPVFSDLEIGSSCQSSRFSSLESMSYECCAHPAPLSDRSTLSTFLQKSCTETLQSLSITVSRQSQWAPVGPPSYYADFNVYREFLHSLFEEVELTRLRKLFIELPDLVDESNFLFLRSQLPPRLNSLVIRSLSLEHADVMKLLESIVGSYSKTQQNNCISGDLGFQGPGPHLSHLELRCVKSFSVAQLDGMLRSFPNLKVLGLRYDFISNRGATNMAPIQFPVGPPVTINGTLTDRQHEAALSAFRAYNYVVKYNRPLGLRELYLHGHDPFFYRVLTEKVPQDLINSLSAALPGVKIRRGLPPVRE